MTTNASPKAAAPTPPDYWTPQEEWIYGELIKGEIADLNSRDGRETPLDPRDEKAKWPGSRILSPRFLKDIVLDSEYSRAIPHQGVRIVGAMFTKPLDFENARLCHLLWLEKSLFKEPVNMRSLRTDFTLSFEGSRLEQKLILSEAQIKSSFYASLGKFAEMEFVFTNVSAQLDMTGSEFTGKLNMNGARVEGPLLMRSDENKRAEFAEVDLTGASMGQIEMTGAKFAGKLNMNGVKVEESLLMRSDETNRAEFAEVDLAGATIGGQVAMKGSKFTKKLNMNAAKVEESLLMRSDGTNRAEFKEVDLVGATIRGHVEMNGSKFTEKLNMNAAKVEGSLLMRSDGTNRAEFAGVDLAGATIGGQINMIGSKFTKKLNMNTVKVEESLFMNSDRETSPHDAEFAEVDLVGATIRGHVAMTGSKFTENVEMEYLKTGEHFRAEGAEFAKPVNLSFCKIGGALNLRAAKLHTLNLTHGQVTADFHLPENYADGTSQWSNGGEIILRNASVGVLDAVESSWPEKVDLTGFRYSRLGGYQFGEEHRMDIGKIDWFENWLAKQKPYSPQPYEQLASVLEKEGYREKAKEILYASRERERKETLKPCEALMHNNYPQFLYEVALNAFYYAEKLFIGYGLYNFLAFRWVFVLLITGVAVLWKSGVGSDLGMPFGIAYSLDMLLPIIRLREWHYTIDITTNWVRWYFYVHQLMGYILALFLVAGLSGLTQRRGKQ